MEDDQGFHVQGDPDQQDGQDSSHDVQNKSVPLRRARWLSRRTAARLAIIVCVVLASTGIALAVAGPFGENLEDVATLEEMQSVADEAEVLLSAQSPDAAAVPQSALTPKNPDVPKTPVEPKNTTESLIEAAEANGDLAGDALALGQAAPGGEEAPSAPPANSDVQSSASKEPATQTTSETAASPAAEDKPESVETEPETIEVEVVVDGSAAGSDVWSRKVTLRPGQTAYDALMGTGADVNARSTVYGMYVAAIGGLAEKDFGPLSGWVYAVDGVEPTVAASGKVLRDGQRLTWTYVNAA